MAQEPVSFTFGKVMDIPSIAIKGPFDFVHPKIDAWVDEQLDTGAATLVLDLSATHYITAQGFASMYKIIKKVSGARGLLHIAGATEDMIELISLGKMDRYVSFIVT